ncbi:hypothetical protein CcrColossus_gp034 [Caulobacter phage CcrColossus]|uniref:Uncharacterized protein n=1 Tax=Caulobacter phage CcrColossus TaxID=1211640 RepID=K4JRH8_9CAUD|nr:hypothetical protein CcrColossus_gp034 [Caulobacter phage CcrColossus]AFU87904.1 hypothetical protein CcrColossus_gp034 [Caulobacter phage CcrColossus]
MTLHHTLMTALDTAQMNGAQADPLHADIRRALRLAQMAGVTLDTAEEVAAAVLRMKVAQQQARRRSRRA